MDEIGIERAFISNLSGCVSDKPKRRAMVDVAIGFVSNVDFSGLQRGQQFNQVAQHRATLVRSRLAMHGSVVILLDQRIGLILFGELLAEDLVIGAVVQVAQIGIRITKYDKVSGSSTQNLKCSAALGLA